MLILACLPIGDARDASAHLIEAIAQVEYVAAEDSRKFARLCQELNIKHHAKVISFFEGNESEKIDELTNILKSQKNILVATDAGAPGISDPGYRLIRAALQADVKIKVLPGPSAVTTALLLSGLPTDRFCFEGFLSSKSAGRRQRLSLLAREKRTLVFYEAPHRLLASIEDMSEIFGPEREASLCRELTKTFETIWTGPLSQLAAFVGADTNQQRGEAVILVAGEASASKQDSLSQDDEHLLEILVAELPLKKASVLAAKYTGKAKQAFYQYGLSLSGDDAG